MERILEISKFRNIGLQTEKPERLLLNNSLCKGRAGNLIILVGANNSGKSNVLDALEQFSKRSLTSRDITTSRYDPEARIPSLALVTKDGGDVFSFKITYNKAENEILYPQKPKPAYTLEKLRTVLKYFADIAPRYNMEPGESVLERWRTILKDDCPQSDLDMVGHEMDTYTEKWYQNYKNGRAKSAWDMFNSGLKNIYSKLTAMQTDNSGDSKYKNMCAEYENRYGIKFMPNVVRYTEKCISNYDLNVSYGNIGNSRFFNALFSAISQPLEKVGNAYQVYKSLNHMGALKDLESELNQKLVSVANKFNKLYFFEENGYSFELSLDSTQVSFILKKGAASVPLDYQSTGFKWFFNLFFNLLCSNSLAAGDILIMDEPATNLHVEGQRELRKFLKEFAVAHDITIIIATHSPFLVDMDYLDELRVIRTENSGACICNDFAAVDADDPDSLGIVKKALTVNNHVLMDPDNKVVFVEGITDYNYMVAFKKLLNEEDVYFLPVKGVGDTADKSFKERQLTVSKKLISLKKSPVLMVDADGAGKMIKSLNSKNSALEVFTLADVDPAFMSIETLFAEEDLTKLGILGKDGSYEKKSSLSALIKTHISDFELSETTLNNFKKLFGYIKNL